MLKQEGATSGADGKAADADGPGIKDEEEKDDVQKKVDDEAVD